jgi:hypothetical protein
MKHLTLFFFLVSAALAASDVRAFWWQEARDKKTGEPYAAFYLAPASVQVFYEALANNDDKTAEAIAAKLPKDAWSYVLLLDRDSATYSKEKITLREGTICGDFPDLVSGTIVVDRKSSIVRIALKVSREGKVADFEGNGVHKWTKAPNKAPEPTTGTVTPRATR